MTFLLIAMLFGFATAFCVALGLYFHAKNRLERYQRIQDAEAYQASCQASARAALEQQQRLHLEIQSLQQQQVAQKNRVAQFQKLLGTFQTAADLQQRIHEDTAKLQQLTATLGRLEHPAQLHAFVQSQQVAIAKQREELASLSNIIGQARTVSEIAAQATYYENYIAQLKADIEAVEETKSLQEFGFYRPRYDFKSAEHFQDRLEQVRAQQKAMLSAKTACVCNTEWTVDGSKSEGRKMVNQQIKLMLRAFNGECDAAVSKVRYNNIVSLQNRLQRSFEQIDKLGEAKRIDLSAEYYKLKLEELFLSHEYQEKKQEEKEEQRQIREQMREEQKVAKEIEKACEAAEREEEMKTIALERARQELAAKSGEQTAKLESLVSRLENELQEALDRKAKAIARAQLTRSGHVYVLSNIGTFGEGVYKIGMSRRLEPLDRVDELGGASVPFPFDVHAMIYSEDAPALENALHRHFEHRRVNLINLRREFFRVTLDEVRAAVAEHFGHVTFVLEPEAEQYRLTMAKLKDLEREQSRLQIA